MSSCCDSSQEPQTPTPTSGDENEVAPTGPLAKLFGKVGQKKTADHQAHNHDQNHQHQQAGCC